MWVINNCQVFFFVRGRHEDEKQETDWISPKNWLYKCLGQAWEGLILWLYHSNGIERYFLKRNMLRSCFYTSLNTSRGTTLSISAATFYFVGDLLSIMIFCRKSKVLLFFLSKRPLITFQHIYRLKVEFSICVLFFWPLNSDSDLHLCDIIWEGSVKRMPYLSAGANSAPFFWLSQRKVKTLFFLKAVN